MPKVERISERNQAAQRALSMDPNDAEMQELLGTPHSSLNKSAHPTMANPSSSQAPTVHQPSQPTLQSPSQLPSQSTLAVTFDAPGRLGPRVAMSAG